MNIRTNRHHPFYLEPDLTLLFVIDPKEALKRIKRKTDAFEKRKFLEKVHENYLSLAENNKRIIILDASLSIEELTKKCLEKISQLQ